ncbi:nucleoside-diphosphate sugar epimerase/dehydratase [Mesorhizobium sp. Root157]|uniref:nucleoside-diphosphate sugar epimerase/dehydratase n=1 Tax=Mesorhizobium sp. Root157 TaxID=1736477 RepID=UPI0009EBF116|nr:nucleoside-diphosphate sugar epimerase/dehydratase [Mesorhizobium sp. Root157]
MVLRDVVNGTRLWRLGGSLLDVFSASTAFWLAYFTAYGNQLLYAVPELGQKTLGFSAIFLFFFWLFSMHRGSWRYVSIPDLVTVIKVAAASVAAYTMAAFVTSRGLHFPRSVPILSFIYLVIGLSSTRLAYRLAMERALFSWRDLDVSPPRKVRDVLLYGLTDNADSFIRANRRRAGSEFNIVGVLDDKILNRARMVQGVKVLGGLSDLKTVVARLARKRIAITELIDTEVGPDRQHLAELVEASAHLGIKASRLPDFRETSLLTSQSILQPKPIDLGDLLGRPEITADLEGVAWLVSGKVVLVTGAGGSIGSELCRQIAEYRPDQLILTDNSEFHLYKLDMEIRENNPKLNVATALMNVRDQGRVTSVFARFRPNLVFHAAALKHVPIVENDSIEGIKTNLMGTRNLADAAVRSRVKNFVMISTDKAVNPTNVMGATKRAAEAYCQALDLASPATMFTTVRFGNVLGSNGSVVPRFERQIKAGGPVTVTDPDVRRFFMTIPEAVCLVLNASAAHADSKRGDIMVLDMGKPVKILDLAQRMIQLAGFKPHVDIGIVFTGLRPGEKLYEELFDSDEVNRRDPDAPYFFASPRVVDKDVLYRTITALESAIANEDQAHAIELLGQIVPEYVPASHGMLRGNGHPGAEAEATTKKFTTQPKPAA